MWQLPLLFIHLHSNLVINFINKKVANQINKSTNDKT